MSSQDYDEIEKIFNGTWNYDRDENVEEFAKADGRDKHYLSRDMCFQQCGILTSVDSDEAVQPPFKHRNSKRCSVSSLTLIEFSSY